MSVDLHDEAALERYASEVEDALDRAALEHTPLWGLIGTWLAAGVVLTLAVRLDVGVLYVLGVVIAVLAFAGFLRARPGADWWRS